MQLDDNVRFERWEPGEKVAGDEPKLEIGPFSQDVKLVGIFRDPETGAGSASVAVSLIRLVSGVDVSHFRNVKTDSLIFKADLAGGRVGMSFYIPKGEVLRFETVYSGTVTIRWIFFFSAPHVSVAQLKDFVVNLDSVGLSSRTPPRAGASTIRASDAAGLRAGPVTMGDFVRSG